MDADHLAGQFLSPSREASQKGERQKGGARKDMRRCNRASPS
jgi:hypothetical protein